MNDSEASVDHPVSAALLNELQDLVDRPIRIMVVCGTQTRVILKYGLNELLPDDLELVSGPGCSVCVMPSGHIDAFVKIGLQPDVITATCEDLLRVPGSRDSLQTIKEKGALVEVVDAPMEALDLARRYPDKIVVFTAVGFEGAAPDVAETILEAAREGIGNFCVVPSIRLLPPSLDNLLRDPELNIRGMLYSSHVESITNTGAYREIAERHHIACAVTGFDCNDIVRGIISIVRQARSGIPERKEFFDRNPVSSEESAITRHMLSEVFFAVETDWRGLGSIAGSGYVIRDELSLYDAVKRFNIRFVPGDEEIQCSCSRIISGKSTPYDCPAFGVFCTSQNPIGPCMVAREGICASYLRYSFRKD